MDYFQGKPDLIGAVILGQAIRSKELRQVGMLRVVSKGAILLFDGCLVFGIVVLDFQSKDSSRLQFQGSEHFRIHTLS